MAHDHTRSVAELRRESERTRDELSQTVETLRLKITDTAADIRQKVSPDHIKAEVSGYVTDKSRHWIDNLKQQARDNPMQALAIGTAVAVPAFKMIRGLPPPLLMIGAGLALASPRVRSAVTESDQWQAARSRAEGAIEEARSAVSGKVSETRGTAADLSGDISQRAAELSDTAGKTLSSARESLSSKVDEASEAAKGAVETTKAKVAETFNTARASARNVVPNNAVLVGGLGLAIGAIIAAALPSSRAERTTLGPPADKLRRAAADAASEKFDEVQAAAMSAADAAADKVAEAGVGPRTNRATEEAADKLKTVTDETITTAFEPSQSDHN
jgi:ElaB/YqjD/DUF883 family membrane-anchored ribosome-binding protein